MVITRKIEDNGDGTMIEKVTMNKLVLGLLLLAGTYVWADDEPNRKTAGAAEPEHVPPNLQPITPCFRPKSDQYYQWAMDRHNDLVKQAKEADIEVAFYGDSVIQFLDDEVWAREAEPLKAGNFGISSDRVEHLLWRPQHGELEGLKRLKVAVVMIGSNNYGSPSSADSIAKGIGLVLKTIRQRQPQARILLLGLSPEGWNKDDDSRRRIKAINALLTGFQARSLCNAYLDWGDVLLNADGSMNRRLSKDGCHYSKAGSEAFFKAVKPAVLKCLKEAAQKSRTDNTIMLGSASRLAGPLASLNLPVASGPFKPTMESLKEYQCPAWFRDAKCGIWAVWGPNSVPMQGDLYSHNLYVQGHEHNKFHLEHFGHPSKVGYKDIIPLWKAEKWDPERLMSLYKKAGAKYFCMIAMHIDNFDCWDSRFQRWNSVNMGPKRDIAGEWRKAARKYGLRFGMSEHLGQCWWWCSASKGADTSGPMKGVHYDGADPKYADLYWTGNENPPEKWYNPKAPLAVKEIWYNRVKDLLDHYHPDLLYSDSCHPYPDEFGRKLLAHYYNDNIQCHGGRLEAVYNCKDHAQGRWVEDLERGVMEHINPEPWQTDTCVGDWYYKTGIKYKSPTLVLQMLADLAAWMPINGESIFGTCPWKIFGEGPSKIKRVEGWGEGGLTYTARDIRFTTKGDAIYALVLGWPDDGKIVVKSLATPAGEVSSVMLLGYNGKLDWAQTNKSLVVTMPSQKPCEHVFVLKVAGDDLKPARAE